MSPTSFFGIYAIRIQHTRDVVLVPTARVAGAAFVLGLLVFGLLVLVLVLRGQPPPPSGVEGGLLPSLLLCLAIFPT